jgi:membrane protein required for colicin V production
MQFTIVDGGVALITLLSALLAYSRGFTREIFAIGGWIIAALAAFYFAPMLKPLMEELPVVGGFLASSCVIAMIAAFSLIVAAVLLVLSVFMPLFSAAIQDSALGPIDRVFGFLFGVVRGVVLIGIAYLIYTSLSGGEAIAELEGAASKALFDEAAALIDQNRPDELPSWFGQRIDALMAPCAGDAPQPTTPSTDGTDS